MPVLAIVRDRLRDEGTLNGRRIAVDLPSDAESAYFTTVLADAGAEVGAANPEVVIDDSGVRYLGVAITTTDARCTRYDNGQAAINAILDRTNLLAADKNIVVAGYGLAGKSVAARCRGLGARVTVCEADPFAALEAHHDGFDVAPLVDACRTANFLISVHCTIGAEAIAALPDGAILFGEIDAAYLREHETREAREHVEEFAMPDGRALFLVSEPARHPAEIMDATFAVQALSAAYLLQHGRDLAPKVHQVPAEIDGDIARMKLRALGIEIDAPA
jgi:adenosylhomocysteinase